MYMYIENLNNFLISLIKNCFDVDELIFQEDNETKGIEVVFKVRKIEYTKRIGNADIDIVKTNWWLKSAGLKAETEKLLIAAEDQSLPTKDYQANIIKKMDQTQYIDYEYKKLNQLTT